MTSLDQPALTSAAPAAAIHDLRSYLAVLEANGELTRISKPVDPVHELANIAATLERKQAGAPLFTAVKGHTIPVFSSAVATQKRAALALGCAQNEVFRVMGAVLEMDNAIRPRVVADAPWKRNVITGDAIDLATLPIPKHAQGDGGPFITGGVTVSRDPSNPERGNLGYNRFQVLGPHTLGMNINEWRDVGQFMKQAEANGQPLPIAIAVGLDPAIMIAAGCKYPDDELFIAGAIRGEPVAVSRGVTVDIRVPVGAEFVIEGYIPPFIRHGEGPLAEFHGYYGELWQSPTLEVTAICYRDNPIWQTIIPGWSEHIYIGNVLPREPLIMRFVKHIAPSVTAVHIPPHANGFMVVIQMAKTNPGQPRNAAMAAFAAHLNPRVCVVVDPDINIYDPADVTWALVNRVDWGQDTFTVPGAQGHQMDPATNNRGVGTKIGIDATYKRDRREYGDRVSYPPVDLAHYLG
jgi:2,5-furandicarboxylate decarboxylase 1